MLTLTCLPFKLSSFHLLGLLSPVTWTLVVSTQSTITAKGIHTAHWDM